jgi:uncharacterized damage-inducible protein DinB
MTNRKTDDMRLAPQLVTLLARDLTRLVQEVRAFPDDGSVWETRLGISNSAGNLVLHLEGNLREYIGRILGGLAYTRRRDLEFSTTGLSIGELAARVEALRDPILAIISGLDDAHMTELFPEPVLDGMRLTTSHFLIHILGHLNYHLGQIDYLRRMVTESSALPLAAL